MSDRPLDGQRVLVLGSAPMTPTLTVEQDEVVIAVNGGISQWPVCDVWIVNSRDIGAASWSPKQRELSRLMLAQGAGRTVGTALLLTKGDGAAAWTLRYLLNQATTVGAFLEVHNDQRRDLETQAGARSADMTKQALSAGLFGVAWAFLSGAASVRMEGFSWAPGYAYETPHPIPVRGHTAGDKQALARLVAKYSERLFTRLTGASTMPTNPAPTPRPTAATVAAARSTRQDARAATSPAAIRERKTAVRETAKQAADEAVRRAPKRVTVRATETTFYDLKRRRPGEVFALRDPSEFRPSCMELVEGDLPAPPPPVDPRTAPIRLGPDGVTPLPQPGRTEPRSGSNPLAID